MKSFLKDKIDLKCIAKTILIPLFSVAIIITIFVITSLNSRSIRIFASFFNKYNIGDIVEEDIYSPLSKEVIDKIKTEKEKKEASLTVIPIFEMNLSQSENNLNIISSLYENYLNDNKENISDNIPIIYQFFSAIISLGYFDKTEIQGLLQNGYSTLKIHNTFGESFNSDKIYPILECATENNIYSLLSVYLKGKVLNTQEEHFISSILSLISSNVHLNYIKTSIEISKAVSEIEPITKHIGVGDIVVHKDSIVTRETIDTLVDLSKVSNFESKTDIIVKSIIILVFSSILFLFLNSYLKNNIRKCLYINFIYISMAVYLLLLGILSYYAKAKYIFASDLLMPQFVIPLLVYNISNKYRLSIYSIFYFALTMMLFQFSGQYSLIRHLMSGIIVITFSKFSTTRVEKMLSYFFCFALEGMFTILSLVLEGYYFYSLITGLIIWVIVFVVGFSLTAIITYIMENVFNLSTINRLEELLYRPNTLLTRYEEACPGSFVHSMLVSKIATAAAENLKLNVPLVTLSAIYHDIGKMEHPQYFIENQVGDNNKHDKINNSISVSLIKSHVAFSISMLKNERFPQELIDIVSQHHGSDTINYFYYEAQREAIKQGGVAEDVNESDFAYDFSPPTSKEAGVLMLADIAEAASRSYISSVLNKGEKLAEDNLKNFIHQLIIQKIENNQLTLSGLTIGDIEKIEEIFSLKIAAENHSRIEYKKVQ